jgi:3-methylcrotonyl-CoA carboxylase alpha subunit
VGNPGKLVNVRRLGMEYSLSVNRENIKMSVVSGSSPEAAEARIGDKKYDFIGKPVSDHELLLTINGRRISACLAHSGEKAEIFLNGKTYTIEDLSEADRRPKKKGGPGEREQKITPPMPAVVIRVLVAEGDAVKKRQPLIVLSAMKMESTLVAPYDGTVKKINAAEGQQVMPGLILIEIEKVPEEEHGN